MAGTVGEKVANAHIFYAKSCSGYDYGSKYFPGLARVGTDTVLPVVVLGEFGR